MTKRPKLPKAVETAVLTQSRRRCCLCFGLNGDTKEKDGQIAHLDDDASNNDPENLAWFCVSHHARWHTHSGMTKSLKVQETKAYRASLYSAVTEGTFIGNDPAMIPIALGPTFSTSAGNGSTVINAAGDVKYNIRSGRKPASIAPPPDAIGSDIKMRSYVEYLTSRYIEWRRMAIKQGIDRRPFFPGTMNNLIKREFGNRVNLVHKCRFGEVVTFVQKAIDNTIWGKRNPHRNYHSFEENSAKVRGTSEV